MVDGGDGPRDTDAEEDVDGVGAGDVSDGGVGGVVLDGGHLTGEGVCSKMKHLSKVQCGLGNRK